MKSIFKICLVAIIVFAAGNVNAQNLKFGHIDHRALLSSMPEIADLQKKMEDEQKGMQAQFDDLQKEYQTKTAELNDTTLSELVLQTKYEAWQELGRRVQNFNQTANEKLEMKQMELLQPIMEKANEAITAVAKEQGVIYVFGVESILYYSNASIDLLPLVKKKLGVQ